MKNRKYKIFVNLGEEFLKNTYILNKECVIYLVAIYTTKSQLILKYL